MAEEVRTQVPRNMKVMVKEGDVVSKATSFSSWR